MHAPTDPPNELRPHILVVDDDAQVATLLNRYLGGQGFRVSVAANGAELDRILGEQPIDLILLDLGLPDEDGLVLLRRFQQHWNGPVIVVSGRGEAVERVVGLELGADDYISKPFDLRELLARVRSVLRRARHGAQEPVGAPGKLAFAGLKLDMATHRLIDREGRDTSLTTGEFDLLRVLLERPHQVLTRDQLMNCLHGRESGPFDRAIDVQIGRLRRKVEVDPTHPILIQSVRGAGYMLAASVQRI